MVSSTPENTKPLAYLWTALEEISVRIHLQFEARVPQEFYSFSDWEHPWRNLCRAKRSTGMEWGLQAHRHVLHDGIVHTLGPVVSPRRHSKWWWVAFLLSFRRSITFSNAGNFLLWQVWIGSFLSNAFFIIFISLSPIQQGTDHPGGDMINYDLSNATDPLSECRQLCCENIECVLWTFAPVSPVCVEFLCWFCK